MYKIKLLIIFFIVSSTFSCIREDWNPTDTIYLINNSIESETSVILHIDSLEIKGISIPPTIMVLNEFLIIPPNEIKEISKHRDMGGKTTEIPFDLGFSSVNTLDSIVISSKKEKVIFYPIDNGKKNIFYKKYYREEIVSNNYIKYYFDLSEDDFK